MLLGGDAVPNYLTTVEEYNPEIDKWDTKTGMPTPRTALTSAVVNGKIFVIGGWNNISPTYPERFLNKLEELTISPGALKGDVNSDGKVDLADAVIALQILGGMLPEGIVNPSADVNGDNKIGMAELIYVQQVTAGLRTP